MNYTQYVEFYCKSIYSTCNQKEGKIYPISIFDPSRNKDDNSAAIISTINTVVACILILFCYSRGCINLSKQRNHIMISDKEKKMSQIMVLIILMFELIYVHGSGFIRGMTVPSISIYIWMLSNWVVVMTLIYSQLFKDMFRFLIYLIFPFYMVIMIVSLIVRCNVDNQFNNYDSLLLIFGSTFAVMTTYSFPKCFHFDDDHIDYVKTKASGKGSNDNAGYNMDAHNSEEMKEMD